MRRRSGLPLLLRALLLGVAVGLLLLLLLLRLGRRRRRVTLMPLTLLGVRLRFLLGGLLGLL